MLTWWNHFKLLKSANLLQKEKLSNSRKNVALFNDLSTKWLPNPALPEYDDDHDDDDDDDDDYNDDDDNDKDHNGDDDND